MRSSTIKALILCRVMKCLTVYNNLLNKLCSSKKVTWVEIITCSLITRGDFMERQHHLIHSEAQTESQILLSWDESIGSLIWAQIRPKQEKSVCVFMDEANWSHWADVAASLGWSASEPSLRPPSALLVPSDWIIQSRWCSLRAGIQDAWVSGHALMKGPAVLLRDPPSWPPPSPPPSQSSIYRPGGQNLSICFDLDAKDQKAI